MVLRAGQRRQEEELEDVERQLPLDDLDVAQDRFARVAGEAEDVAGPGDGAVLCHVCSILRYSVILFWRFLAASRLSGIDVLQPDEDAVDAGLRALSMKFGMRWHCVSTWMVKPMFGLRRAQLDQAVEDSQCGCGRYCRR